MNILSKACKNLCNDDSLLSQFLLTYGTMIVILILLFIIQFCTISNVSTTSDVSTISDNVTGISGPNASAIWGLVINTFTPTTITFVASLIFERSEIKDNKVTSSLLLLFIICMALIYMAFEAIAAQVPNDTAIIILGFLGLLVPAVALLVLFSTSTVEDINSHNHNNDTSTSDGIISARR